MTGLVIKNIADSFGVKLDNGSVVTAFGRGKLKRFDSIKVGDKVNLELQKEGTYIITFVHPRKNNFDRPPLSNLDQLFIVISQIPAPDFELVDKLIVKCYLHNVEPILIISKTDIIDNDFAKNIVNEYENAVKNIIFASGITGEGIDEILSLARGNISSFVGQSAVGKSTLINALGGRAEVGELSAKLKRGKNTTRHSEIYLLTSGAFVADTPGFSRFDLKELKYSDLNLYYPDFVDFRSGCRYPNCSHTHEKIEECAVKSAVNACKINKNRYNRYCNIFNELKKFWEEKYE